MLVHVSASEAAARRRAAMILHKTNKHVVSVQKARERARQASEKVQRFKTKHAKLLDMLRVLEQRQTQMHNDAKKREPALGYTHFGKAEPLLSAQKLLNII